jgi:hypothetical protein
MASLPKYTCSRGPRKRPKGGAETQAPVLLQVNLPNKQKAAVVSQALLPSGLEILSQTSVESPIIIAAASAIK